MSDEPATMTTPATAAEAEFEKLAEGFVRPPEQTEAPVELPLTKRGGYEAFLKAEGYRYEVDEDGDLTFKREGKNFYLFADEDDPEYFLLSLPKFLQTRSEEEVARAVRVAHEQSREFKVVKVVIHEKWAWASVEMFISPFDGFRNVFERCLDCIVAASREFTERMRKDAK